MNAVKVTDEIKKLIQDKALFVINHSGGKDSQAMYLELRKLIPADQILLVHADLGEIEWDGAKEHIEATTAGEELQIVKAVFQDGSEKTFFKRVRKGTRNKKTGEVVRRFPGMKQRFCTSELKTGPVFKLINRVCKDRGITKVVNCLGLRAQESDERADKPQFEYLEKASATDRGNRRVWQWLPIKWMREDEVFETIRAAGQEPHWVYGAGMSRMSCAFCIYSTDADLKRAAELRPELYAKYVAMEKEIDHTFIMPKTVKGKRVKRYLEDITGIKAVKA